MKYYPKKTFVITVLHYSYSRPLLYEYISHSDVRDVDLWIISNKTHKLVAWLHPSLYFSYCNAYKTSMARIRERTIPTERSPLVGEVSANFCG
jgi:hypothetical protein